MDTCRNKVFEGEGGVGMKVILSLFPGIGLLDRAFEEVFDGVACIVRGPDLLWGGDIRRFHVPPGIFSGIIGGPPCQCFSKLAPLIRVQGYEPRFGNLIPDYERVVSEAQPVWFLMENVPGAPVPVVGGYGVHDLLLDNRWVGGEQMRKRRFSFGTRDGRALRIDYVALEEPITYEAVTSGNGFENGADYYRRTDQSVLGNTRNVPVRIGGNGKLKRTATTVTSSDGGGKVKMTRYSIEESTRLQGLPEDFLSDAPFTKEGKLKAIANGVPLPMGRAIAHAVKDAILA